MQRRKIIGAGLVTLLAALGAGGVWAWRAKRAGPALPVARTPAALADIDAMLTPLTPPSRPLTVYHLGHSLVGRDMPSFLAQMAGHSHHSQLGWGTPLRAHWEDAIEITGFEAENAHDRFSPAKESLESGNYDTVVLTEMVDLKDAITWHASPYYLANWAELARAGNPDTRIYLYESWHRLDVDGGWLARLDADLPKLWLGEVLQGAAAWGAPPIYLIPAGQVMAEVARRAEAGQIPGMTRREDLFAVAADGSQDMIHPSDLGNFLVALTHFAVLYHRMPDALPSRLLRADGTSFDIDPAIADALARLTWTVVKATPRTGIQP